MLLLSEIRSAGAQDAETVGRDAIDAVNQFLATGDMNAIDGVFAPDLKGHPPHRSLETGEAYSHDLAGLKAALDEMRRYFRDAEFVPEDVITEGDKVAGRFTFRGTLDPTAFGIPAEAAQPLDAGGVIFGGVAGNKVVEFWAYFDVAELTTLLKAGTPVP